MLEIANMEQYCATLGTEFDSRAVHLVAPTVREQVVATQEKDHIPGFIAASSQDCIFGARENWKWLVTLVQCVETHLKNAAHYHQFFHEVDETSYHMADDLDRLHNSFETFNVKGDSQDGKRLLAEIDEIVTAFKQWEAKVNHGWEEAVKIVPVHLRVQGVEDPTPCRALANYKTNDINIQEGEDLLLLDNSHHDLWKVKNARGQEAMVPALICLIPGPHKDAIDAAIRMRLKLLASWTNSLKRVGKRLIFFMLKVFKPDYREDEIQTMQSIKPREKAELMRMLDNIEDTMKVHWKEHEGFINLQERILSLRMILENTPDHELKRDEETYQKLVTQIEILEKLMKRYKELWKMWEMYKVALEMSRQPELMLIVDRWEQLQYVTREYFTKFWQADLPFDQIDKSISGLEHVLDEIYIEGLDKVKRKPEPRVVRQAGEATMHEEGVETMEEHTVETTQAGASEQDEGDYGYAEETKTAETEQVSSSEVEEKKTFVIRAVVDPSSGEEVSLQDAIMNGIINPNQGLYINKATGDAIPIPVAMSQGSIKVEFTSTKRSKEKKSTMGIITVKTIRMHDSEGNPKQQVISKTYAVRAVVDRRAKKTVSFDEAVQRGIIDRDSGAFKDTLTGDKMYVGDAIMRGFLKARPIEDPSSLDIDPKNKMVIDKTEKIKDRLIKPLGALSALRAASKS